MRARTLLLVVIVVTIASAILSQLINPEQFGSSHRYPRPLAQVQARRILQEKKFKLLFRIKYYTTDADTNLLYYIWILDVGPNGAIYAFDFGRQVILKFDSLGQFLGKIGEGPGAGPSEFRNVSGFSIDASDRVWVCDPPLNRVTCFDSLGNLVMDISPTRLISRVGFANGHIIAKLDQTNSPLFAWLNQKGSIHHLFGWVHELQEKAIIAMDGPVVFKGKRVYAFFFRLPFFVKFNSDGKIAYFRKTIGNYTLPTLHTKNIQGQMAAWIDKSAPWISISASVDLREKRIFILTLPERKGGKSLVDVYSEKNGEYLYSFELPENVRGAKIWNSTVYAAQDTMISVWRILN